MIKRILLPFTIILLILGAFSVSLVAQDDIRIETGIIDNENPFAEFSLVVGGSGQSIVLDLIRTSGDLDTLLYLVDEAGDIIAENDDRVRGDYSSLIRYPYADPGVYTVVATRYKLLDGDSTGDFELKISLEPTAQESFPVDISPETLAATGFPEIEARPESDWTILAYYGGDTNLEAGLLNDFNEFELGGGSNDNVRIVMLMDRHPEYTDASGNWASTRIFEIGPDVSDDVGVVFPPTVDSEPLVDLGAQDTGSGELLAQFLTWGVQSFPSKHYAVAFASHGAGWEGIVTDESAAEDETILSMPELIAAFTSAQQTADLEKFDLLINDACSMSSVEYFADLDRFFRISVASPEIIVDPAMDMTLLTEQLNAGRADADVVAVSDALVDTYIERDMLLSGDADAVYFTNAVTDLDKFDSVTAAVENFARVINQDPVAYSLMLGKARSNTYTYTHFAGNITKVDLRDLMNQVIALTTDSDVLDAAQTVLDALDTALLHSQGGERVVERGVGYYNIYFPDNESYFKASSYFEETSLVEWARMLRNYYNAVSPKSWSSGEDLMPFHVPGSPTVTLSSVFPEDGISTLNPVNIWMEVVGRSIAYVDFTVDLIQDDDTAVRYSSERILTEELVDEKLVRRNNWNPGISTQNIRWDPRLPVVSDGTVSDFELLVFTEDVAFLDGYYLEPGGQTWNLVSLVFDFEDQFLSGGRVIRVINRAVETDALGVVEIPVGSTFIAFKTNVQPDGTIAQDLGTYYTWPDGGLTWSWAPAPTGDYNIGALVTAYGGDVASDSRTVSINNDGVDTALIGETRTDFGFRLARPIEWQRLAFSNNDFFFRSVNADGTQNVTVYLGVAGVTLEAVDADVAAWLPNLLGAYGLTPLDEPTPTTIAGQDVVTVSYQYETEAGTFQGRGFAHYNVALGVGEFFTTEVLDGAGDLDALYDQLVEYFGFFDVVDVAATSQWAIRPNVFPPPYQYPVRFSWLVEGEGSDPAVGGLVDGLWVKYGPEGDATGPTFAAVMVDPGAGSDGDAFHERLMTEFVGETTTQESRPYSVGDQLWQVTEFAATRDSGAVMGRLYTMIVGETGYAFWVEAPDDENLLNVFAETFEPMLDGFVVNESSAQ